MNINAFNEGKTFKVKRSVQPPLFTPLPYVDTTRDLPVFPPAAKLASRLLAKIINAFQSVLGASSFAFRYAICIHIIELMVRMAIFFMAFCNTVRWCEHCRVLHAAAAAREATVLERADRIGKSSAMGWDQVGVASATGRMATLAG